MKNNVDPLVAGTLFLVAIAMCLIAGANQASQAREARDMAYQFCLTATGGNEAVCKWKVYKERFRYYE